MLKVSPKPTLLQKTVNTILKNTIKFYIYKALEK